MSRNEHGFHAVKQIDKQTVSCERQGQTDDVFQRLIGFRLITAKVLNSYESNKIKSMEKSMENSSPKKRPDTASKGVIGCCSLDQIIQMT